jgi:hypothetical protein
MLKSVPTPWSTPNGRDQKQHGWQDGQRRACPKERKSPVRTAPYDQEIQIQNNIFKIGK